MRKYTSEESRARQREVLNFVRTYIEQHGYSPTVREIVDNCDVSSTSVASYVLNDLEAAGELRRTEGIARSIVLTKEAA